MTIYCIEKNCDLLKQIEETGHYAIEASAGTGKTYTISKIFFDLIVSRNAEPEDILVTTFTRDATAELRERLRNEIENAIVGYDNAVREKERKEKEKENARCDNNNAELCLDAAGPKDVSSNHDNYWRIDEEAYKKLLECERQFDKITVSTLDSLVQRILRENRDLSLSFGDFQIVENFSGDDAYRLFMSDIVAHDEDGALIALISAYKDLETDKRTSLDTDSFGNSENAFRDDLEKYASKYASLAKHLNYNELGFDDFKDFALQYRKWFEECIECASQMNNDSFAKVFCEVIEPLKKDDAPKKNTESMTKKGSETKRKTAANKVSAAEKESETKKEPDNAPDKLIANEIYMRLTDKRWNKRNWVWFADKLRNWSLRCGEQQPQDASAGEAGSLSKRRAVKSEAAKRAIEELNKTKCAHPQETGFAGDLSPDELRRRFVCLLKCLKLCAFGKKQVLFSHAIEPYRECLAKDKAAKRQYTYDDFTRNLTQSLRNGEEGDWLADAVKKRWKYAIIDEFQDTNAEQWNILKTCFLDDDHQLFLIGDPKQAIYGFRNCDVFIYRQAVAEIANPSQNAPADNAAAMPAPRKLKLGENHRSAPQIVEAVNRLYTNSNDLFWGEEEVKNYIDDDADGKLNHYERVEPANNNWHCIDIRSGRELPGLVVSEIAEGIKKATKEWSEKIAEIITNEYLPQTYFFFGEKDYNEYNKYAKSDPDNRDGRKNRFDKAFRPIRSIFVLCSTRTELKHLRTELIARGFNFEDSKKKNNMFGTQESRDLLRIMCAIENPDKKNYLAAALNTMFFGLPVYMVKDIIAMPRSKVRDKFGEWAKLSKDNTKFSALFEDILITTRFRARLNVCATTESPYWTVRRLIDKLADVAVCENMDWHDLVAYAKRALWDNAADDAKDNSEGALMRGDLKIQLKTIHGCKGLEADVVFVLPNPSECDRKIRDLCHEKDGSGWNPVVDPDPVPKKESAADLEDRLELERLFYVALTRAKFRLHVPKYANANSEICKKLNKALDKYVETLAPVPPPISETERCKLLSDFCAFHPNQKPKYISVLRDLQENARAAAAQDGARSCADSAPETDASDIARGASAASLRDDIVQKLKDYDALSAHVAGNARRDDNSARFNHSYSELKRRKKQDAGDSAMFIGGLPRDAGRPESALPRGTNTGLFLHEAFEKIDFSAVRRIRDFCERRPISESDGIGACGIERFCRTSNESIGADEISADLSAIDRLFQKLETKYKLSNNRGAIDEAKRIVLRTLTGRHRKFSDPIDASCNPDGLALCDADAAIPEMAFLSDSDRIEGIGKNFYTPNDMFNGSIDCCCRFGSAWFIIDWKSDSLPDYADATLRAHAEQAYRDQIAIYASAFKKWLCSIDPRNYYAFGGMVYVFLRGVAPTGDGGFCWFSPEDIDLLAKA